MLKRVEHKVLIKPEDLKPAGKDFEIVGVFNPGAVRVKDDIYILVRVAERPRKRKKGYFPFPRVDTDKGKTVIDWLRVKKGGGDMRTFELLEEGIRLTFISHLRLVKLDSTGFNVKEIIQKPLFKPEEDYEEFGVEDPRITEINGAYYITYVAVSRTMGVSTALAVTVNFKKFERAGIIFPLENKDVVLFPETLNDHYLAIHRPVGACRFSTPNMQISRSPDLIHWGQHRFLMGTRPGYWDDYKLGAGPPPLKTEKGWLVIYHGVKKEDNDPVGIYCAGAALFDLSDPEKLIARSDEPLMMPEEIHEKEGYVPNVVFPTGMVEDKDGKHIILYAGGADTVVTATKYSLGDILNSLEYL